VKRIWFAIIFVAIVASLCVTEQIFVKNFYLDIKNQLSIAQSCIDNDDKENLKKSIDHIQKDWEKDRVFLFSISDNTALDDLERNINSLNTDYEKSDIKKSLDETQALAEIFYNNQRVLINNIF
jgi:hypothetical protein